MRYSHSSLSSFDNCPRQFYYRYVAKVRLPERVKSISLHLGGCVHTTLEHLYRQVMNGLVPSRADLIEHYQACWEREWSDTIDLHGEGTPESWRQLGARCVGEYYDRHHPFDDARMIDVEKELRFSLDADDRYGLIGYVDRLARRDDGTWEIHDYKTDKRLPSQGDKDEDRQLALYEIGIRQLWPSLGDVELVWHYLRFDQEIRSRRTKTELEELTARTISLIDDIEQREEERDFPTNETALCGWCDYQAVCPVRKHARVVESLPPDRFLDEPGVTLVDRWTALKERRAEMRDRAAEIDAEIEEVKQALIALAEREGLEIVVGSEMEARVTLGTKAVFPRKTAEPERAAALEDELRRSPWWNQASTVDAKRLRELWEHMDEHEPELRTILAKFVTHEAQRDAGLRKKR